MSKEYPGIITRVPEDSLAAELGLVSGDKIISINGQPLRDIIDLSFALADEEIDLLIEHADGEREIISFEKDIDEELGCEFASAVFDGIRRCANNCYFCFVNMVAPGMRTSLSIKDDDYRLSFLYGNFITLTNMGPRDFDRIRRLHLSPLYVSVQCMNPELRAAMLRCPGAARISEQLDHLEQAGVQYHTQIVLCAGLNDGPELERTLRELIARRPHVLSIAIVPVGITKYRTDSYPLQQFDAAGAAQVIETVEKWQARMRAEEGRTFIYLGDEFYFLAGREVPPAEMYDGFPQLDNGIGLTRNFIGEWEQASHASPSSSRTSPAGRHHHICVVTGTSVAGVFRQLAASLTKQRDDIEVTVLPVVNEYFGATVNVSGLLTAQDMIKAIKQQDEPYDGLLIPEPALRSGDDIFLDDMSWTEFQQQFPDRKVELAQTGHDYYAALADWEHYHKQRSAETNYTWQSNAGYTK